MGLSHITIYMASTMQCSLKAAFFKCLWLWEQWTEYIFQGQETREELPITWVHLEVQPSVISSHWPLPTSTHHYLGCHGDNIALNNSSRKQENLVQIPKTLYQGNIYLHKCICVNMLINMFIPWNPLASLHQSFQVMLRIRGVGLLR